ncbi:hypothetical protein KM043_006578 [Ampulex compressa]|nr:hypothetical protein KM043_006578 [Ampulex compressa]
MSGRVSAESRTCPTVILSVGEPHGRHGADTLAGAQCHCWKGPSKSSRHMRCLYELAFPSGPANSEHARILKWTHDYFRLRHISANLRPVRPPGHLWDRMSGGLLPKIQPRRKDRGFILEEKRYPRPDGGTRDGTLFRSSAFGRTIRLISASVNDYNDNTSLRFGVGRKAGERHADKRGRATHEVEEEDRKDPQPGEAEKPGGQGREVSNAVDGTCIRWIAASFENPHGRTPSCTPMCHFGLRLVLGADTMDSDRVGRDNGTCYGGNEMSPSVN